ncbi:E3 ubiquitin-protein ligase RING1-like [Lolium rigidum]|uniref:E3 ubiquitin-protein ligase RING1-like n=1 Tax=Lolium rigidum TaxID=89674 RepID=UPI001F5C8120|nr:E3 ubiquitin-protein ligase RING1-like [Lolium rigidum]
MDSANDARRAEARAAGILRLLMGMAAGAGAGAMPGARGVMLVQHVLVGGDGTGDLFSGGVGGGVPPASKAAIAALREVRAEQEGSPLGDCAICLDAFDAGKEMPCGHRFHGECLDRWLGVHGSCPVCRSELPKPDPAAAAEEEQQQNGDERQGPPGAVLLSFLVMGAPQQQEQEEQMEVEEPWNIRVEDVD